MLQHLQERGYDFSMNIRNIPKLYEADGWEDLEIPFLTCLHVQRNV